MYTSLLFFHSIFRWLVLVSLLLAILNAWRGYTSGRIYSKADNALRHWTATIAHVQLIIGFSLYLVSPLVKLAFSGTTAGSGLSEPVFFGYIHIALMLSSIVVITIGSALSKRKSVDKDKFKTQLLWFGVALFLIFIAIPWPFSPLANRPLFRPF